MKLKRSIVCLIVAVMVASVYAQDVQRLADEEIEGTARYVGLAGAMTAVGGDPSAIKDNPAGLGIYRHSQASVTMVGALDFTRDIKDVKAGNILRANFMLPQASYVFSFGHPDRQKGVIFNNVMLGFSRVKSFNREYSMRLSDQPVSIGDAVTENMNKMGFAHNVFNNKAGYNNKDLSWISCLMYDAYALNPDTVKGGWSQSAPAGNLNSRLDVIENGYHNRFDFHYGMNVSNRFFWGVGLNIHWLYYSKQTEYVESYQAGGNMGLQTSLVQKGVGISGNIGILVHPIRALRIGASIHTPSAYNLRQNISGEMSSSWMPTGSSSAKTSTYTSNERFIMPFRASAGLALQLKNYGLLSLQCDYAHWKNMDDVYTLKAGIEGVIANRFMLQGGYAYESSFLKKDSRWGFDMNTIRCDWDFRTIRYSQYVNLGFNYRGNYLGVGVAYQFRWQIAHWYGFVDQVAPFVSSNHTHRFVVTLQWNS